MSQIKVEKLKGLNVPDNGPELSIDSSGNFNFDSGALYIDSVNNRIGINNPTPLYSLDVTGSARITGSLTTSGGISASNGTGAAGQLLTANGTGGMSWQNAPISLPEQSSSTSGAVLMSNGTSAFWTYTLSPLGNLTNPNWATARTFTHGFVAGGYKDSSPWRNVNITTHSNDTSTNLGDLLSHAASYLDGGFGDYYAYSYGTEDGYPGTTSRTSSFHMTTQTGRGTNSSWNMSVNRNDSATFQDYHHSGAKCYITGGGSARTDRHNLSTEVMSTSGFPPDCGDGGDYAAAVHGRNRGWYKRSGTAQSFAWATESYSSWGGAPGSDGWGKGLDTMKGWGYMKTGGNTVTGIAKFNDDTGSNISSFNVENSGEENFEMGQEKGYCLGHYNGAQNNNTYKVNYNSDTYASLGSTAQPKGHAGMSSATEHSASSLTNNAYGTSAPAY
jgi:hypothetical protein